MLVKLTKAEVGDLAGALQSFSGKTVSCHFDYARAKNLARLKPEIEAIEAVRKPLSGIEGKRVALCTKFCEKDGKGEPITKGGMYVGLSDNEEFLSEIGVLQQEANRVGLEIADFLKGMTEVDLYLLPLADFPDAGPAGYMSALMPMVEEKTT